VKKHRHLSSSRSIPLIGAVGLARPFPVGVISQLASLFQGFAALGTNGHLACSFESGLSRLSVFIGRQASLQTSMFDPAFANGRQAAVPLQVKSRR
jgi:hypothetical protein